MSWLRAGVIAGFAADGVLGAVVLVAGLLGHGPSIPDVLLLTALWLVYLLPFGILVSLVLTRLRLPARPRAWLLAGASTGGVAALAGFVAQVRSASALLLPVAAGAGLGAVAGAVVRALVPGRTRRM